MAHLNKHTTTNLIRSGKPLVQPDKAFVLQLQQKLHDEAVQLTGSAGMAHSPSQPRRRWFHVVSAMSVGAMAVIAMVFVFIPGWSKPTTRLTGYIQKGPFISGSTITVQLLNDQLQPTGATYQVTTTNDFGNYSLIQNIPTHYVEVSANGFYYDEVRGDLSAAPLTLHSIADISDHHTVNINVLTTLAEPRIETLVTTQGMSFADAKKQAEQEVLEIFHISQPTDSAFESMDISQAGINNGILLAISVLLQGHQSVAQLSELLSKLSLDIQTDGSVASDSALLSTIQANASQLSTHDITTNLNDRYTTLGVDATVPDFADWLKPFVTNADPFSYQISLQLDNVFEVNHTPDASIDVTIYGEGFVKDKETVALKGLYAATKVNYSDNSIITATFPISQLSAGSYTVTVTNADTGRMGVTDGEPLETTSLNPATTRLILEGAAPTITNVTASVPYLTGGTVAITGTSFAYGTFVWINGWQVPADAIRVANDQLINVDLSPALIVNNAQLPRNTNLTITVQTPDFQSVIKAGFEIK